ncbi:PREDICTED: uncharacterized protein LOC108555288 [Eufriesea mexicana]|uniref:uncharacterized protein LOC108555288 n=1 Tax=Eufriesea mexicana TaxID=516756 RepID=UPI00083C1DEE|nr:PREDICTED: uncharacterized protein LOC108555288 [Eufriesea mexicana]
MRITCVLFGLWLLVAYVHCSPVDKREAEPEDLSPLNEVYIVEAEDDQAADGDRSDRDKRKIGVLKLGVSNGIINFVFSKLDSFIDSKTKALIALEDANKVKNAAYGIDTKHSATGKFISDLVAAKIQAASGSIGPVIHSAQTLIAGTKSGLADAALSKLAPLSSIATGVSAGLAGKLEHGAHAVHAAHSGHGGHGVDLGVSHHDNSGVTGTVLSNLLNSLTELSHKGGAVSGPSAHGHDAPVVGHPGAYASLGAGGPISTTTEDIPEFDRTKVSLEIPPNVFGTGFTLITNISKIVSSVILNSARRTQTLLEIFKPFFRGALAIKGLPSDNPH